MTLPLVGPLLDNKNSYSYRILNFFCFLHNLLYEQYFSYIQGRIQDLWLGGRE
jgi:hypothetical protein